ncbi:MAG: zinc-binding dehydrogenase [Saprospiraceae bacterium]|nr:zinc-binding dehydrogenase [Saprospiraceae bacterium]
MKALLFKELKQFPILTEIPDLSTSDTTDALVEIKAAALNRRDYFITQGLYPGIKIPMILGSDGVGFYEGDRVLINPSLDWGKDPGVQDKSFQVLGMPTSGTLAEMIAVPHDRLHSVPSHLSMDEAASLPLAGLTAYRALFTRGCLRKGQTLLITGIGGGVASTALQFALAVGAIVAVTSGSQAKIDKAISLGAVQGVNYRDSDWRTQIANEIPGFDLVLDSAGGSGFAELVKLTKPGGTICIYGGTRGAINGLSPQSIFWKQLNIKGSTMGSDEDFNQMLSLVEAHSIRPIVDSIYAMGESAEAFRRLADSQQFGKIVIRIAD